MKLIIDEKVCEKHKLTLEEVLLALVIRMSKDTSETIKSMEEREIINCVDGKYYVTQHWSDIIDSIACESSGDVEKTDEELTTLALQLMSIFPKQKMRDKFGRETPYYYRCNKTEIKVKLKKFFERFGNYTDDEILDATRRYVAEYSKKGFRGMRLAKYFIWKNDEKAYDDGEKHVDTISDLATYLENKDEGTVEEGSSDEDWMLNAKN